MGATPQRNDSQGLTLAEKLLQDKRLKEQKEKARIKAALDKKKADDAKKEKDKLDKLKAQKMKERSDAEIKKLADAKAKKEKDELDKLKAQKLAADKNKNKNKGNTSSSSKATNTPSTSTSSSTVNSSNITTIDPVTKKPRLMTGEELAELYGITADRGSIEKLLLNAVDTKYTNLDRAQARTERNYYDQVATSQDSLLDTLRKNRTNAVMSGATKGMNAANELAAMLMTSQQNSLGATTVAQTGADLAKLKEADRAAAVLEALTKSNDAGVNIMGRAVGAYDSEYVGYSADRSAESNILAEQLRAASNKEVAGISAAGSLAAAKASAAGYGGGGSYSSGYTTPTVDPMQQKIANLIAIGSKTSLKEAERLMGITDEKKPPNPRPNPPIVPAEQTDYSPRTNLDRK